MNVDPGLWRCLLPSSAALVGRDLPAPLDQIARDNRQGDRRVLVAWDARPRTLRDVESFFALVLFNPRSISARDLQAVGFTEIRRFLAVPSARTTRWLLPAERSWPSAALPPMYTPFRPTARALAFGLGVAAEALAHAGILDRVWIAQRAKPEIEHRLEEIAGASVAALSLAATGWGLRPTNLLAAFNPKREPTAFVKFPCSTLSRSSVANEAETLRALARDDLRDLAPQLLFEGLVDGRYAVMQRPVVGQRAPLGLTDAHHHFLDRLARGQRHLAPGSSFITGLRTSLAALPERDEQLWECFPAVVSVLETLQLPKTIVHGDFAPLNLRVVGRSLLAFDWEDATLDGLPLIDLFHHEAEVGFLLRGWSVDRVYRRIIELTNRPTEMEPKHADALAALYAIDSYVRRREGGHAAHDPVAGRYRELFSRIARRMDLQPPAGPGALRRRPVRSS